MNCFGIGSVRRPKNRAVGLRKAGTESDPQVYLRRPNLTDSRPKLEPVSVSHPGFTQSLTYESSYPSERQPQELREFTLQELKSATKSFDLKNVIGEGGFGHVYKGTIKQKAKFHDGEEKLEVAIKQLNTSGLQVGSPLHFRISFLWLKFQSKFQTGQSVCKDFSFFRAGA
jgi:serine/threonine protein kinase